MVLMTVQYNKKDHQSDGGQNNKQVKNGINGAQGSSLEHFTTDISLNDIHIRIIIKGSNYADKHSSI